MSTNDPRPDYQHQLLQLSAKNKLRLLSLTGKDPSQVCERDEWSSEYRVAIERELDDWERQQQEIDLIRDVPSYNYLYTDTTPLSFPFLVREGGDVNAQLGLSSNFTGGVHTKFEASSGKCSRWESPKIINDKSEEDKASIKWWPPELCLHPSDFCEECQDINFEQAWSHRPRYYERNTELYKEKLRDLEGIEWLVNASNCHFCRYLVNARRCRSGTPDAGKFFLRISRNLGRSVPQEGHECPMPSQVYIRVSYPPIERVQSTRVTLNIIICHAGRPTRLACIPQIVPPLLDGSLAKTWLEACKRDHSECEKEDDSTMPETRLINCRTRELILVGPEDNCRRPFVALSYVWGPDPVKTFDLIEGEFQYLQLPAQVPRTIEDAITITKSLGIDYLWVDQFCINQRNEADQKRQIRHMDLIYKCADLTIIAAAGNSREYGIPGVSSPRKHVLEPFVLETTSPSPSQLTFGTSPRRNAPWQSGSWPTRVWTFQEALLSRRRLVFSESKMHFECKCHAQIRKEEHGGVQSGYIMDGGFEKPNESGDYQTVCGKITLSTPFEIGPAKVTHKAQVKSLLTYIELVAQYTTRQLSFAKDGLNAFRGVANSLQRFEKPVYSIAGIPFVVPGYDKTDEDNLLAEATFSFGLSWHSMGGKMAEGSGSHNTDDEFPSWSWGNTQLWDVTWKWAERPNYFPGEKWEQDLYGLDTGIISGLGDLRVDFVDGQAQRQLSLAEFAESCRVGRDSSNSTLPYQWKARALSFKARVLSPCYTRGLYESKSSDTFSFSGNFFVDLSFGPSSNKPELVVFVAHGDTGIRERCVRFGHAGHHAGGWDCEYTTPNGKLPQEILSGSCGLVLLYCGGERTSILVVQWQNDANDSQKIARRSGIIRLHTANHLDKLLRCFSSGVDLILV